MTSQMPFPSDMMKVGKKSILFETTMYLHTSSNSGLHEYLISKHIITLCMAGQAMQCDE